VPAAVGAGTVAAVRTVHATRYVTPLREGGSMPGLVEADDDGLYVLKFRGAGQGPKALVAELVAGGLARAAGLPVPELVLVELDPQLGAAEPDPEIQELIAASGGRNVGMDFLPGSLAYSPAAGSVPDRPLPAEPGSPRGSRAMVVEHVLAGVPAEWFAPRAREEYAAYLDLRLEAPRGFAAEAEEARRGA